MPIKAVVFDFDGTLAKTDIPAVKTLAWLIKNRKLLPKSMKNPIGLFHALMRSDPDLFISELHRISGKELSKEELRELENSMERIMDENAKSSRMDPQAVRLIPELKGRGVVIAVSSLASKERILKTLDKHGLTKHIDIIMSREHSKSRERRLAMVLDQLKENGIKPSEVLVVGDMPTDVRASKSLGLKSAIVLRKGMSWLQRGFFKKYKTEPDYFLRSLSHIRRIV